MRPVIEHAIRTGYVKENLKFPFALFLESIWDDSYRLVLTVKKIYGKEGSLCVTHWEISKINKFDPMPPRRDFIIPVEELYSSKHTVLSDYITIDYVHENYEYQRTPDWIDDPSGWNDREQSKYEGVLERTFFSEEHKSKRESILWDSFLSGYMPVSFRHVNNICVEGQRAVIKELNPKLWNSWMLWRKYLLDLDSVVSPELAFYLEYETNAALKLKEQKYELDEELLEKKYELNSSIGTFYISPNIDPTD